MELQYPSRTLNNRSGTFWSGNTTPIWRASNFLVRCARQDAQQGLPIHSGLKIVERSQTNNSTSNLPLGPSKLPLIGTLHSLTHHATSDMAKKHGPLMSLQLGEVLTIAVSLAEVAKDVMKTLDIIFTSRPEVIAARIMSYNSTNLAFSRYTNSSLFPHMELQYSSFPILFTLFLFVYLLLKIVKRSKTNNSTSNLPPRPWKLPLIGNLHQLASSLPHHAMRDLAKKHGPLTSLQFGEVLIIVVSSAEVAKEVMKTHDIIFASRIEVIATRIEVIATRIMSYNSTNMVFSPYGPYWRQLRKICMSTLLTPKHVLSFQSIRQEEVSKLVGFIGSTAGSSINLSEEIFSLVFGVTSGAALGRRFIDQERFILVVEDALKVLSGFNVVDYYPRAEWLHSISGVRSKLKKFHIEADWIMENMMQEHISRRAAYQTGKEEREDDPMDALFGYHSCGPNEFSLTINNIKALILLVVKETLRLHPAVPFLLPRECGESCVINGYEIPEKAIVFVNAWAIARDPEVWKDPESFIPERFLDSSVDCKGNHFEYIPFGAGRRICPSMNFGLTNVEFELTQLLLHFDWKLPDGMKEEDMDMTEDFGVTVRRKQQLKVIPVAYKNSTI